MKTQAQFTAFKTASLENEPLTREVLLSDIQIASENSILYRGKEFKCTEQAINDIAEIVGVPKTFASSFGKSFGNAGKQKLVELQKSARIASGKGITITLAANKVFGIIERVYKGSQILPYATYFDTFEKLMNNHKLDIVDFGQTPTGVFISTKSVEDEFKVGNFGNETFHPGFTLTNNLSNGLVLDSYLYRLICTNGMVGQSFGHSIKYNPESMSDFFKSLIEFKSSGLIPLGFKDKVTQAIHTKASYAEVHSAAKIITNNSNLTMDLVDRFVPVNDIRRKFALKGADTTKWNAAQEKNAITNVTVWDVVNGLTDFASHDYGFDVKESNRLSMQKQAGDLLGKPAFDTQNLVHVSL